MPLETSTRRSRRRLVAWLGVVAVLIAAAAVVVTARALRPAPSVAWPTDDPERHGFSRASLDSLRTALAARGTGALLIAHEGSLIYEWYGPGASANRRFGAAALAKAVLGSRVLLSLVEAGVVGLDDRVADYFPDWDADSLKSRVTLRQLASHSAGLDDVYFPPRDAADRWFAGQPEWKRRYFERPEERFRIARTSVPFLYVAGTARRYSGIGYYVLSYTLSTALAARSAGDLREWVARRIYAPLEVPADAWSMSYGQGYPEGGLTLYAIGSGAAFTARALARIGQEIIDRRADSAFAALRGITADLPLHLLPEDSIGVMRRSVLHLGWWGNDAGAWPSLPADALVGLGANDQVVLVVPSLALVVVRCGDSLTGEHLAHDPEAVLEEMVFAPLIRARRPGS